MADTTVRSLLIPSSGFRDVAKTVRPSVAAGKLQARLDWLRFSRRIELEPGGATERLGSRYGGYVIPQGLVRPDWICYSAGLGTDVSFELELVRRYGCTMHAFDPTPDAYAHAEREAAAEPRFKPLPYGLWSSDTTMRFFAPRDPSHVSHSIANIHGGSGSIEASCRSIRSLMRELGHDRLDLLKLDVEGAEYEVLGAMLEDGIRPRLLCVDVHKVQSIDAMAGLVDRLRGAGYRPVHLHRTDVTLVASGEG